jgi:hypothetical protein
LDRHKYNKKRSVARRELWSLALLADHIVIPPGDLPYNEEAIEISELDEVHKSGKCLLSIEIRMTIQNYVERRLDRGVNEGKALPPTEHVGGILSIFSSVPELFLRDIPSQRLLFRKCVVDAISARMRSDETSRDSRRRLERLLNTIDDCDAGLEFSRTLVRAKSRTINTANKRLIMRSMDEGYFVACGVANYSYIYVAATFRRYAEH